MIENTYVARQPILNGNSELWAYELLFRSCDPQGSANIVDATSATAQVLHNSTQMGIQNIIGNNKAFFNCNRDILLDDVVQILDRDVFVLEILEDVELDDTVVSAVKKLKEQKFTIALDDFIMDRENIERANKVIDLIDIIKVDLMLTPRELWQNAAEYTKKNGKIALAEKVETAECFNECKKYGYDYFQGYFFAKPQVMESKKISTAAITTMGLLDKIRNEKPNKEIEAEFKQSPELSLNLLKLINSSAFGLRSSISSLSHAIAMYGIKNLERWLMLLLYAQRESGGMKTASPIFEHVIMRASAMENIAKLCRKSKSSTEKAFLVGLVSLMDTLFGVAVEEIMKEFNFDEEINGAVLRHEGTLGLILKTVSAYESDNPEVLKDSISELGITAEEFSMCIKNAFEQSNSHRNA